MSNLPAQMQVMAIRDGRLSLETRDVPALRAGEVLIRVAYAGVNRADLFQVQGSYPAPEDGSDLPGLEVSGHLAALGAEVSGWRVGEAVCALTNGGGYAEYVGVPATHLLPVPAPLTLAEAASLPEACATAAMTLIQEAALADGERVLIHGGASGIGVVLVQAARALGATVFATASDAKHPQLTQLGATPLPYSPEFSTRTLAKIGEGMDVIIDTLGGPYLAHHVKLLRKSGRLVIIACLEGGKGEFSMGALLMKHLRISGVTLRGQPSDKKSQIMHIVRQTLWPLVLAGAIRPVMDGVFPLKDAEKAHARMENRLNLGKMVLEVTGAQAN
jgi:NADPH2:quinone reductase